MNAALLVGVAIAFGCRSNEFSESATSALSIQPATQDQPAGYGQAASLDQQAPKGPHAHPPKRELEAFVAEVGLPRDMTEHAWRVLENSETLSDLLERTTPIGRFTQVELGRKLFFERRLSKSGKLACATCHDLQRHGVDGKQTAVGHNGQQGLRNTPTVLNIAASSLLFWDGRAKTLEVQARDPLLNPMEMALEDEQHAVRNLSSMPKYVTAFERAFPEHQTPLSFPNILTALSAFQRTLITPAPWDQYVAGNEDAVPVSAKRGFVLFQHHGCARCHRGEAVGGNSLWTLGMHEPWPNQKDQGRFESTKLEADKMRFRVPSLRNVGKTAPYFHDGSAQTLQEAVQLMARVQLGKTLPQSEVDSLIDYLDTLTGELPKALLETPELAARPR